MSSAAETHADTAGVPAVPGLFGLPEAAPADRWREAFGAWRREMQRQSRLRKGSSLAVYAHMWQALANWATAKGLGPEDLRAGHLGDYLDDRARGDEPLTPRYALRLMRLTDRVLALHCRTYDLPMPQAGARLLDRRPALRHAESSSQEPPLEHLDDEETVLLARHLLRTVHDVRAPWQVRRNAAAAALQLGGGLNPAEIRALTLDAAQLSTRCRNWRVIEVAANGTAPGHHAPVAHWADRVLQTWLGLRRRLDIPGERVFPSTRSSGRPWGKVAFYDGMRRLFEAAGVSRAEGGSFRLRHTWALRQLERNTAPATLALWLGVHDAGVVERYQRTLLDRIPLDRT